LCVRLVIYKDYTSDHLVDNLVCTNRKTEVCGTIILSVGLHGSIILSLTSNGSGGCLTTGFY
jgi:hypothetical protein